MQKARAQEVMKNKEKLLRANTQKNLVKCKNRDFFSEELQSFEMFKTLGLKRV